MPKKMAKIATRRLQVFTRLPAEDANAETVRAPHVGEHELDPKAESLALVTRKYRYMRNKNIVYAIEAFVLAHKLGLYPPAWVVEILVDRFRCWHEGQGRESMDVVLGLRSKGRGRRDPAFARVRYEERDEMLALDCARLVGLGKTVGTAAAAVVARLKATKEWDKSGWRLRALDEDQVRKRYQALDNAVRADVTKYVSAWSNEKREAYLRLFQDSKIDLLRPSRR